MPGAAGQRCLGRFDAAGKSLWTHRLSGSGDSPLRVLLEGEDTWLGGSLKAFGGEARDDNLYVLRIAATGGVSGDEPIVATASGEIDTFVVQDGKAWLSVTLTQDYVPFFPGRPWSHSFRDYYQTPLIVVAP